MPPRDGSEGQREGSRARNRLATHLIIPSSPRRSSPRSSPRPISPVNPEPLVTAEMQRDMDMHQDPGQQPAAQPEPMDQQETQQEPEPEPEPDIRILEVIYAPEDREGGGPDDEDPAEEAVRDTEFARMLEEDRLEDEKLRKKKEKRKKADRKYYYEKRRPRKLAIRKHQEALIREAARRAAIRTTPANAEAG